MGQPPRHGHGGWSQRPVRLPVPTKAQNMVGGGPASISQVEPRAFEQIEERNVGVMRFKELDKFLTQLPNPGIQHLTRHESTLWDPNRFFGIGAVIQIFESIVPDNMVEILTDVQWFAIGPGHGLMSSPRLLNEAALYGQAHFQILFNGRTPIELEGEYSNAPGGNNTAPFGRVNGYPFVQRDVGTEAPTFAVYARGGARITARITTVALQTFPITVVGARMKGYTLPLSTFSGIWDGGV